MNLGIANVEIVAYEKLESKLPISDEQMNLMNAMKDGWVLLRERFTHSFYMKKEAESPFIMMFGVVYKKTAIFLINNRLIKEDKICQKSKDMIFILTQNGEKICQ